MHDTQVDGLRSAITSAPRSAIATEVAELAMPAMPAMPDEIERIAQGTGIEPGLGLGRVTLNNKSSGIPGRFTHSAALLTLAPRHPRHQRPDRGVRSIAGGAELAVDLHVVAGIRDTLDA